VSDNFEQKTSLLDMFLRTLCRKVSVILISLHLLTLFFLQTLSTLQLGLLTACAILISCVDLQSRPAQAASSLGFRIISALAVRPYFKSVPWGREAGDWVPWLLRYRAGGGVSPSSSSPNSITGSDGSSTWSGKDVSSFRIPDRKLKARAARANKYQQQQRQQHRSQPSWTTPRVSGLESQSLTPPVTPPTAAGIAAATAGVSPFARSKSMPPPTTTSDPAPPTTSSSPLSPRSPLHFTLGVGRRVPTTPGRSNRFNTTNYTTSADDSGLSTGTFFNPNARRSSIIGGDLLSPRRFSHYNHHHSHHHNHNSMAPSASAPPLHRNTNTTNDDTSFSFSPPSSEGCRTPDLVTAATWSSQATASLSSLTARVDAIIRPLVPPAPSTLMRWPSSPASWSFGAFNATTAVSEEDAGNADASDNGTTTIDSGATMSNRDRYAQVVSPPLHKSPAGRRVSLDANHGCSSRHYTHGGIAADASRRPALERYAYAARMAVGNDKAAAASAFPGRVLRTTTTATAASGLNVDALTAAGSASSAVASIGLDGDCPESIRQIITDEHLLQLGALMGEAASRAVIEDVDLPFACTQADSLCGAPDYTTQSGHNNNATSGWEELTAVKNQQLPGLRLRSWRLLMRKGLYAYKTVVEIDGVDPSDIRPFHLDDQARALWDDGALEVLRPTPAGCTRASRHAESCLHSYLSKFPGPLASRRYNYARRVWHRPSDGGCYVISQHCGITDEALTAAASSSASALDGPTREKIRAVAVLEYTSAAVIRAVAGGSEISTFYFEDSQVRAGLAKVAVPKGLWPFWTKYEAALRLFADARAVAHSLPPPTDAPDTTTTTTTATAATGSGVNGGGGGSAAARRRVPTNFDAWNGGSFALNDDYDGNESDGEVSDDELYGALVQLKAARKRAADRRGGALGASTRWARGIVIAGALKMMHVMLATQ
jgi:hypothetical protein